MLYGDLKKFQSKRLFSPTEVDLCPLISGREPMDNFMPAGETSSCADPWNVKEPETPELENESKIPDLAEIPPAFRPAWVSSEAVDYEELLNDSNTPLVLKCKQMKNEDGGLDYWFTVKLPDAEQRLVWKITTPTYEKHEEGEKDEEIGIDQ